MSGPFTVDGRPEAEARIRDDLGRIQEEVLALGSDRDLLGIVLLGGYARGEGTVVAGSDGDLRGFNDYDLLLVFEEVPADAGPWRALSRRLAAELEIDFVDLGLAGRDDLRRAAPILFWYELGEAHRWLWRRPGVDLELPRFRSEDLDPAEPSRLLVNRGMALLWGALRLWPGGTEPGRGAAAPEEAALRFSVIAAHKAILAAGDAALLGAGIWSLRQEERLERLQGDPGLVAWAGDGFLAAYARGVAFRRTPSFPSTAEARELWWQARGHHEAGFRAAEELRLGTGVPDWTAHAASVRGRAFRERTRHPRRALRSAARVLRRNSWLEIEETLFTTMPELLYGPTRGEGGEPGGLREWRRRSEDLVGRWHP